MRKTLPLLLAFLVWVHVSAFAAEPATATPRASASANTRLLQRMQEIMRNVRSTRYSHKTEVDEKAGSYNVDCSGLARFVLRQTAPEALRALPHEPGLSYPRAVSFYSAFTNFDSPRITAYWQLVPHVRDVEPGDLIAWRKIHIEKGDNSGHVLMALEKPVRESDGSFRVKVVDSSAGNHAEDSRGKGESGIGTGVMWFLVDAEGKPKAFRWSAASKGKECPISIGRLRN